MFGIALRSAESLFHRYRLTIPRYSLDGFSPDLLVNGDCVANHDSRPYSLPQPRLPISKTLRANGPHRHGHLGSWISLSPQSIQSSVLDYLAGRVDFGNRDVHHECLQQH